MYPGTEQQVNGEKMGEIRFFTMEWKVTDKQEEEATMIRILAND
jgi:hypothetical protein